MKWMKLLLIIASLCLLIGCGNQPSEKVLAYQENKEIIGPEKDTIIGDISETIYESIDRSNSKAEEMVIGPIRAEGVKIVPPEGRYTISPGMSFDGAPNSGRIEIVDEEGRQLLHEVLDTFYGVYNITVDLNGSHTVYMDGLEEAILTPAETQLSNELSAGIWEVGLDIEPGTYSVHTETEYGYGFEILGDLMIFEEGKSPRLFEILDVSSESPIELELKEGQKLRISNISYLKFEPK